MVNSGCAFTTVSALVWSSQAPSPPLAIFCYQVFFVYDPSSSTSLLSSAMDQTKAKNGKRDEGERAEDGGVGVSETWYLVLGSHAARRGHVGRTARALN